jgi:tetratricopeptide (TPR) repeat protein
LATEGQVVLGSVARLYTLQGRYDEAEKLIDRAVATQEKIYGPDNHLIAGSWLTKARVCQAKDNYVRSEKLIEKALSAVRKTGNTAIYTKLEQRAEEIRASNQTTSGPVAKGRVRYFAPFADSQIICPFSRKIREK